ncbi:unnamed protein product, partial [Ectocarpus fasciculatus]
MPPAPAAPQRQLGPRVSGNNNSNSKYVHSDLPRLFQQKPAPSPTTRRQPGAFREPGDRALVPRGRRERWLGG